ncbi:hypothetical protein TI39_contig4422g00002 [Zymoseptoria brevis]|uniref:Uncharacterized protein n=1 Tax=Zymoseptoria brevis TaxID=1047168 RepID=A0A0F4G6S9_9PEZI|nr:hypothetical protein TI39_contig4422g00002 [Zymoseptoria brevis]
MAGYHPSIPWPTNLAEFDLEADILIERSFGSSTPQLSPAAYADHGFGPVMGTQPEAVAEEERQPTDEVEEGRVNSFVTLPLAEERSNRALGLAEDEDVKVEAAKMDPVRENEKGRKQGITMSLPIRSKKEGKHGVIKL